jgi:hypothetical protein
MHISARARELEPEEPDLAGLPRDNSRGNPRTGNVEKPRESD